MCESELGKQIDDRRTIDFLEHLPHSFNIIVIEEPSLRILLILFEGNSEGVGDIHGLSVVLTE